MKYELKPFNLEFTQELYDYGFDIPNELIQKFVSADRTEAIEDLENIIKDEYLNFNPDEFKEENLSLIHALFLLPELNAEESLTVVLDMLKQEERFFDLCFGDVLSVDLWIVILKIGKNQIDKCIDFLKMPGLYTYARNSVAEALEQMCYYFPDLKNQIATGFQELLETLINEDENHVDSEFNGLFIWSLADLNLVQSLPQIKTLYEKGFVNPGICGTYSKIEVDIHKERELKHRKYELKSNREFYESFLETADPLEKEKIQKFKTPKRVKIGRNDSCPCGSGKKFKKCCLGKGIYD